MDLLKLVLTRLVEMENIALILAPAFQLLGFVVQVRNLLHALGE